MTIGCSCANLDDASKVCIGCFGLEEMELSLVVINSHTNEGPPLSGVLNACFTSVGGISKGTWVV